MDRIKVLIVDDEVSLSDIIRRSLLKLYDSYDISVASTGGKGLQLLKEAEFNVLVTDIRMPGISGIDLMKQASEIHEDLQTIIITGHKDYDYAIEALRQGAVNYIKKPIPIEPLHYAIIKAYEKQILKKQLKESEEKFRSIASGAIDSILLLDNTGCIVFWNSAAEKLFGYQRDEVIHKLVMDQVIPQRFHDEFQSIFSSYLTVDDYFIGDSNLTRLNARNKAGTEFPVEMTMSRVIINNADHIVCVLRDISTRVIAEEQLRQSQKMESIGQLAGGVAHDFNNILTGIIGFADLAAEIISTEHPAYNYIDALIKRADDAATLVQQLLAFSRKQILDLKIINVNQVLGQTSEFLAKIMHDDIQLKSSFQVGLENIKADPNALQQMITNLCLNSQAAMPNGGVIKIATENKVLDDEFCQLHSPLQPGEYVRITVKDNGTGIPVEIQEHVYEPFFTTKDTGKGTGLGLSMVYGLVQQHNGYITFTSSVNEGTSFEILFPVSRDTVGDMLQNDGSLLELGTETVLVVEDDLDVLTILKSILERTGFNTLVAVDGKDALDVLGKSNQPIDLIISDIIMPKLSGTELYKRVKEIWPDIEFLFISGHASTSSGKFTISENMAFLQKPFTAKQLNKKIRTLLDNRKSQLQKRV